jgi:hypothetical protein
MHKTSSLLNSFVRLPMAGGSTFGAVLALMRPLALALELIATMGSLRAEYLCIDYQYYPNTNNFRTYDTFILSPYAQVNFKASQAAGKKFLAYISAGEVAKNAQYYQQAQIAGIPFISENPNWASMVVDLASPLWAPFVVSQLALRAINQGYDGFFLDTMDSYYLTDSSRWSAQEAGLVDMVKQLRAAYPTKKIIINRGFPVFDRLKGVVDGMLVEGLYYTYPGQPQSSSSTQWLLGQLAPVKSAGTPVYICDYVPNNDIQLANQTASRISQQGFVPLVVGQNLDGTVLAPKPPSGPPPRLEILPGLGLRFTASANQTYTVEYCDSLGDGTWSKLRDVAAQTSTRVVQLSDSWAVDKTSRFYRVVQR